MTSAGPVGIALVFMLSRRCNLQCRYCNVDAGPWVRGQLDVDLVESWVGALAALGPVRIGVQLHGGEPLMASPPVEAYAGAAHRAVGPWPAAGLGTVGLVTNGTLLDRGRAQSLGAAGIEVIVSVDGPAAVHDRMRVGPHGRGSHAAAMRGVGVLRDAGTEPRVLAVVSTPDDARAALEFFLGEGLAHVKINPVRPEGRAGAAADRHEIGARRMAAAYLDMAATIARHNRRWPQRAIHEENLVRLMARVVGGGDGRPTWTLLVDDQGVLWAHPGGHGTEHMRLTSGQAPTPALLGAVLGLDHAGPDRAARLAARQVATMRPCADCPDPLWCTRFRPVVEPRDGAAVDPDCEWRRRVTEGLRSWWEADPHEAAWVLPARVAMAAEESAQR